MTSASPEPPAPLLLDTFTLSARKVRVSVSNARRQSTIHNPRSLTLAAELEYDQYRRSAENIELEALSSTRFPPIVAQSLTTFKEMPPLDSTAVATQRHALERRDWASENPGPILVFCIVFIVAMGVIILFLYRKWMARRATQQSYE